MLQNLIINVINKIKILNRPAGTISFLLINLTTLDNNYAF